MWTNGVSMSAKLRTWLGRAYLVLDARWADLGDTWTAVKPARFSLMAILLVWLVLRFTGQGKDFLIAVGEDAAIWSAEPATVLQMPAGFLVRFFRNHGLLQLEDRPQWRVLCSSR